jgi:phosphoglucomutase
MSHAGIHFGTAGWRGVIGEEFTFGRVRLAAGAVAHLVRKQEKSPKLLVGYDTRFLSEDFARAAAEMLEREGVHAILADRPTPTPALAYEILRRKVSGGILLTASHNPSEYGGLKFSDESGASAGPAKAAEIERLAAKLAGEGWEAKREETASRTTEIETADFSPAYLERLGELVRFKAMRRARLTVTYDAMHGAGEGWLDRLLAANRMAVETLHPERDVLFEGQSPDPLPAHLRELAHVVRRNRASLGLATDDAAERFGILDGDGRFISPNHILGLLYDYLVESRGWRLGVARSVATSRLVDAVARMHGLTVYETKVGFRHIAPLVVEDGVALGGEESAGLTIRGHVPEKDGILACLLVAEMRAERGPLEAQLAQLFRRVGSEFWPVRHDVALDAAARERLAGWLESDPSEFLGRRVTGTNHTDGLKLEFESGSWLLVRPSGTEPLSRIYAEAASLEEASRLAKEAEQWMHNLN